MEKRTPFPFIKFLSRSRDRTKDHFVFMYFFRFQLSIVLFCRAIIIVILVEYKKHSKIKAVNESIKNSREREVIKSNKSKMLIYCLRFSTCH